MNDAAFEKEKKRVQKYLNKWKNTLGLGTHKLNITWDRSYKTENPDVAVDCQNSWQYRLITLTIYTPVTSENDDDELEHIIIHELSHSLIAPLAQHIGEEHDDVHEFATECVAQAILWAYEHGKAGK